MTDDITCQISACMEPIRCARTRKSNPICLGCPGICTRTISVTLDYDTYDKIKTNCAEGVDVADELALAAKLLADGKLMVHRGIKDQLVRGLNR